MGVRYRRQGDAGGYKEEKTPTWVHGHGWLDAARAAHWHKWSTSVVAARALYERKAVGIGEALVGAEKSEQSGEMARRAA